MTKIIRTQKDVFEDNTENIKCSQIDNVQREGVLSISEEVRLFNRQKQNIAKNIDISKAETSAEVTREKRLKEVHDIIDEKREIDKLIKKNKEKISQLQEEQKEIYSQLEAEINMEQVNTQTE